MYVKYAKDSYSGRVLGVVVATATNQVGFALAKPNGDITKIVKQELVMVAVARSTTNSIKENVEALEFFLERDGNYSKSNNDFMDKVDLVHELFLDMCWKAQNSATLPTMVGKRV
ncbi:MAG: hypothetical protein HGA35_02080 [Erysipelotrichaceae bacterium]|nr:hypothetical protein [Erysipelotrichaceae bacterium]